MIKKTSSQNWVTVKIPFDMKKQIEKVLKTKKAKRLGFTSKSQFVVNSIRKELEKFKN